MRISAGPNAASGGSKLLADEWGEYRPDFARNLTLIFLP
jgi:hypothetical protein